MVKKHLSPPSFMLRLSLKVISWELKTGKWTSYVIKVKIKESGPYIQRSFVRFTTGEALQMHLSSTAQVCGQSEGSVGRGNGCPDDAIGQLCIFAKVAPSTAAALDRV